MDQQNDQNEEKDIFTQAVEILQKGNYKKSVEARSILTSMLTKLSFFSDFDNDPVFTPYAQKCIDLLEYQVYQKDEPVFLYGERGDTVYFVLKGQAAIYIPRNESEKLNAFKIQNKFNKSKKKCVTYKNSDKEEHYKQKYLKYTTQIQQCLQNAINEYQNNHKQQIGQHIYRIVHVAMQGGQFGELSVLFGKNRSATIAAYNGPLHIIGIKGNDYLHIFNNMLEQLNYVLFCLQNKFPSARKNVLATLANCFSIKRKYRLNERIYSEGEFSNHIFIVKKGSVGLLKSICEHKKQEVIREISFINENQFFGHEAMLLHNPLRITTAVSTYYETVVLGIHKIAFNKVLLGQQDQKEMRIFARDNIEGYQHKANQLYEEYIASLSVLKKPNAAYDQKQNFYSKAITLQPFDGKSNQIQGQALDQATNPHLTVENFKKFKQQQGTQSLKSFQDTNLKQEHIQNYIDDMIIANEHKDAKKIKTEAQQNDNQNEKKNNKQSKKANKQQQQHQQSQQDDVRLPEIDIKNQLQLQDTKEQIKLDNMRKQLQSQNFRISKMKLQGYHNNYQDEAKVFLQQQLEKHFTFSNPLQQTSPLRLSNITEQQFLKTVSTKLNPIVLPNKEDQKESKQIQKVELKSDSLKINTYQQFFNVVQNRLANKNKKSESSFIMSERTKEDAQLNNSKQQTENNDKKQKTNEQQINSQKDLIQINNQSNNTK